MPTKSTNKGAHGGRRAGSGRKPKPLIDKINEGTVDEDTLVLNLPDIEGADMPKPSAFLSAQQRDGQQNQALEIFNDTWNWLKSIGCHKYFSTKLIEQYAESSARWIQCEEKINEFGLVGKHPTTGKPIPSPFVTMSVTFMNQSLRIWDMIYSIIQQNCSVSYKGANPQDDVMERLLRAKRG